MTEKEDARKIVAETKAAQQMSSLPKASVEKGKAAAVTSKDSVVNAPGGATSGVIAGGPKDTTLPGATAQKDAIGGGGSIVCVIPPATNPYAPMYPSMVSATMVVAGWIVVNKVQSNQERRKQIRAYISTLRSDLDELEELVIRYHTSEREIPLERQIISKLGRFEKASSGLPRFVSSQVIFRAVKPKLLKITDENLQKLRKAMTLDHFFDEHVGALNAQHELIQGIELATELVQEDLECVRIAALD